MQKLLETAQDIASEIVRDRRALHSMAETGFDLPQTFSYVWKALEGIGLTPRKCGRCGIVADIGAGTPCVMLRADMDALPIREEADVPFACETGKMHACGHDLHTAMLLGAARLLKAREREIDGTVRLMFQPAEEPLAGAEDMISNGLLAAPRPEAAFMIHVLTNIDLPVGTAIVSAPGVSAPGAAMFAVKVQGKGCHGAMPNMGVDPLMAAAHIVLGLETISTRELALNDAHALTIGMFHAGDTANVIPDTATLQGSMRAFDSDSLEYILRRIGEIARQTAAAFRASAETTILRRCDTLVNDGELSSMTLATLQQLLGEQMALLSSQLGGENAKSSGSEDFAQVSHQVPSLMIALAAGRPSEGYDAPAHHPRTKFDESALPIGAVIYAAAAMQKFGRK